MRITSGNTQIDFSVTGSGQYMQTISNNGGKLIKTTPNISTFMGWLTNSVLEKARLELAKRRPQVFIYACVCCDTGFNPGHGVKIEGKEVCSSCKNNYEYFDYFRRTARLSDRAIYELTEIIL